MRDTATLREAIDITAKKLKISRKKAASLLLPAIKSGEVKVLIPESFVEKAVALCRSIPGLSADDALVRVMLKQA